MEACLTIQVAENSTQTCKNSVFRFVNFTSSKTLSSFFVHSFCEVLLYTTVHILMVNFVGGWGIVLFFYFYFFFSPLEVQRHIAAVPAPVARSSQCLGANTTDGSMVVISDSTGALGKSLHRIAHSG